MLELRNYFTKYLAAVKAKKEVQLERKTVIDCDDYLKSYGYYKEEDVKEKSKERTEKQSKRVHYRLTTW